MGKRGRARQRTSVARRQQPPVRRTTDPVGVVQQELVQQQQIVSQSWRGPIPDPDSLGRYKEIDDRLPDRILAMAEKTLELTTAQTHHRIQMERRAILGMNMRANIGLWMAFVIAVVVLFGSFWLINNDHDAAGAAIAAVDLVGLVGVFVYGRHDQRRQESERTG